MGSCLLCTGGGTPAGGVAIGPPPTAAAAGGGVAIGLPPTAAAAGGGVAIGLGQMDSKTPVVSSYAQSRGYSEDPDVAF